jgi:DNA-binding CsgD family transcriptional regulator
MTGEAVGREQELGAVDAFLDSPPPAGCVLDGEAGIGKSTLWLAGVAAARQRGYLVQTSRPAEAEQGLPYLGLGDLLGGVPAGVLDALTPPRRHALEVALVLEGTPRDPVDPRALALGVLDVVQMLSESETLLIAIDDVQWLDQASAMALAIALRRLGTGSVLVMLARRSVGGVRPSELEEALGERVERLHVGPLGVEALHRVLSEHLGRAFARQTLRRIHTQSGGNPFFALELARALDAEVDPTRPLPIPDTLEGLVRARISGLPAPTREALALAAALGTPPVSLLEKAGITVETLDPALASQVIERENETIRFTHPLLASVLYADLGDARRNVHRRIARVVDDPLARARHLALAADAPDAAIAETLDGAAQLAANRGAAGETAELAEHALRLTPAGNRPERHRRALAAARAHRLAGERLRGRALAIDLLREPLDGSLHPEALMMLAELEPLERSTELLEEALAEAESWPALQSVIHARLAWQGRFRNGFPDAREHARAALALAEELDDDALIVGALNVLARLGCMIGDSDARAQAARAQALATASGDVELLKEAAHTVAWTLIESGDYGAARLVLEREHRDGLERDEPWAVRMLWWLAWVELAVGNWSLAAEYADSCRDLHLQYEFESPMDHIPSALVALHRGQLELARSQAERALQLAEEQIGIHMPIHPAILGLVAAWSGEPADGAALLARGEEQATSLGWGESSQFTRPWRADYFETLLELGRVDEALPLIDVWEAGAARLGNRWVLAQATRCRGLAAAAEGDVARAVSLLEEAVARHEQVGDPFGRARALLGLGVVRRRAHQKAPARAAIRAALAGFEELGALTWVEKARAELGAIGGRTRIDGLTPAEQRVAALVVEGRTNREVAAALFLGERTVETHLSHVYAKLGVRSRVELATRLRTGSVEPEQSSGGLTIPS